MRLSGLFVLVLSGVVGFASLAAACGNDSGSTVNPALTPRPVTTAGTTPAVNPTFGPTPELKGNIEKVFPAYAAKVTQASTRSPDATNPGGACVQVNFSGLGSGNAQWFRMAFDKAEVTQKLTWSVDSFDNPTKGHVCYAPVEGFTVGSHVVAISVRDPKDNSAPVKQVTSWGFEVTP